ncbi:hypothetical protein B0A77_11895 [Flavobacterium branchiophilum]|uniref:Uncharacterized protein n=1 Tax=Flavobacterium branchiophilum TaxID=55197 RepID=A0A2H3K9L7_9FLAO|nr:hypothetical protein B0A77_11895 [Flavobacterium branchiophilum]
MFNKLFVKYSIFFKTKLKVLTNYMMSNDVVAFCLLIKTNFYIRIVLGKNKYYFFYKNKKK